MNTVDDWQSQQDGIADRLRQMRAAAGLTGKALADRFGWQQSKVSRLENGRYQPTEGDIRNWVNACGETDAVADEMTAALIGVQAGHRDWKRRMRRGADMVQAGYNQLVADSARVCHFETAYVPGLLQTPAYAHHVLSEGVALADAGDADVSAAVALRMQRQQMLYDTGRQFEFLLTESVLRLVAVPPKVMRGQLDRLHSVVGLPNIRFGILPFGSQLHLFPQNSFQLYDDVAVVETFVGEWTHRDDDAALYRRVLEAMWQDAIEGDAARLLISAAADALPTDVKA